MLLFVFLIAYVALRKTSSQCLPECSVELFSSSKTSPSNIAMHSSLSRCRRQEYLYDCNIC